MRPLHHILLPLLACCWLLPAPPPLAAKQPLPVIVTEARSEQMADRLELLGTLRANETVEITASVTDTITAIHFEDGQLVQQGDILVEMTSSEEHAQLEEEQSNLEEARKQYERVAPLVRRGAAAQALLDQRQRELATAQARMRAIESRLMDRLILAPFTGVVGLRIISKGALVEPGDVITTLDDLSQMKLDFQVPAIHLAALRPGIEVEARSPAFGERVFAGKVSSISSRVDPATRSVLVRALLSNQEGLLRPGMLMRVTMVKNPRQAVTIPEEALIPSGTDNSVLLLATSGNITKATKKQVELGTRRAGRVEITAGLVAGELVITHGTQKVRAGQEVTILAKDSGGQALDELLPEKGETESP